MYLHLGQDFIVNTRDVIGVFDLDTFVLTDFPDDTVYITQISTAAIRNRAAKFDMGQ